MHGRLFGALLIALCAFGCAGKKPVVPPEKLWSDGESAFKDGAYELAVEKYKALLDQHPFDTRAEEAELKIAQSHYLAERYPEAIASFGDFERMHPTSSNLPFIEYHLGMSYLAQASTSDRDQQAHTNALTYFRNLTDRFPTSPFAEKARLRARECREALAKHEADIAAYYLRQGSLRAAESRLRGLLTEYPETDASAQALYTFAQAYAKRDENEGATLALSTLVHHHPDGPLGQEARERLGEKDTSASGGDPLPLLLNRLDQNRDQADRQKVPNTVSAYPDVGGTTQPRY
jgi:outer membrane protein assembly factor BamD